MEATTILKGKYTPTDFFKKPVHASVQDTTFTINDGEITVVIKHKVESKYNSTRILRTTIDQTERKLAWLFVLAKSIEQPTYKFDILEATLQLADNTTHTTQQSPWSDWVAVDLRETPKIEQEDINLAIRSLAYIEDNATLKAILSFLNLSRTDKAREISHLYDIRESLENKFGDWKNACNNLHVDEKLWGRLGQLANKKGLRQGRHIGSHHTHLRDASREELDEARTITRHIINKYLDHLEQKSEQNNSSQN